MLTKWLNKLQQHIFIHRNKMAFELDYDLDKAMQRQNINMKDLQSLREAVTNIAPKDITDKQVFS